MAFDYGVYDYVEDGLGVVYAASGPGNLLSSYRTLYRYTSELNNYIGSVESGGFFPVGSAGDFQAEIDLLGVTTSVNSYAEVYFQTSYVEGMNIQVQQYEIPIFSPLTHPEGGVVLINDVLSVTGGFDPAPVPVPATAWLFLSSVGLFVGLTKVIKN